MDTVWVTRVEQLEDYREQWHDLAIRMGRPYSLPAWQLAWWRHAAPKASQLRVLLVLDGSELAAVGPFFLDRWRGLSRLRLLGAGTSSAVEALVRPGFERSLAGALQTALTKERLADLVMLEGTPASDGWLESFTGLCRGSQAPLHAVGSWTQPSPIVTLSEGGFDAWFAAKGSKFRARIRRGARQLESLGGGHRLVSDTDSVSRAISAFETLHERRWKARGGSDVLTTGVGRLLREFAASSPENLRIWTVEVEGRPISVQIFLVAGGTVSHWLGGLDDSFQQLRPGAGVQSLQVALEHAWRSGDRLFDFGAGGQEHKYRFADSEIQLLHTSMCRSRLHSGLIRLGEAPSLLRRELSRKLPSSAKRRIRSLLRRVQVSDD